ncbi:MAG TPA: hypothetical protein VKE93_13790 [Candidatus Angelobacter sp.]|nr:hypothetical protein [Candidatus Angelobacter sp.]
MRSSFCASVLLVALSVALRAAPQSVVPSQPSQPHDGASQALSPSLTVIPGPLRSFQRMAGISSKASPDEILFLLAHEMTARGYQGARPTEYLIQLRLYVRQARELVAFAGPESVIHVSSCQDALPLLSLLGYGLRQPCGKDTAVEVSESSRAFLTINSGFPLAELEEALREGKPFSMPYASSRVPVLFALNDWAEFGDNTKTKAKQPDLIDILLNSKSVARLYSALGSMDSETGIAIRKSIGLPKLVRYANVLDFYGNHLCIRSGKVAVPGGPSAEAGWAELVGASPDSPGEFVNRLMTQDGGWMAAYFDALAHTGPEQQAYLTESPRLRRDYLALRSHEVSPGAARGILRSGAGFWLLATRLPLESGHLFVPGDLQVWKNAFEHNHFSKREREWAKRAASWNDPQQLLEGLFALSRESRKDGPLEAYLMVSEVERRRPPQQRLSPEVAGLLAERFPRFGDQYIVFSEFPGLNDQSITAFLKAADELDNISAATVRANAIGIFQSVLGLWQILARQGQISSTDLNDSWQRAITPFAGVQSPVQLFDAGHASLQAVMSASAGRADLTQDELISLLAGPNLVTPAAQETKHELAKKMSSVMDAQRLVSLDTLFTLGAGLEQMGEGKATSENLLPLATQLREFELPRPIFNRNLEDIQAGREKSDVRHTTLQTRTDMQKIIKSGTSKERAEARGRLAPFLRDTLVGLNYTYYDPPGAQMLSNDAVFVRSHDYTEKSDIPWEQPWSTSRRVTVIGANSGGHLAGSLAGLPYALAELEQNFIVPENVQSLIWEDFVPTLLTSAVVPRFWGVTQNELHAAALYQRAGEELVTAAGGDEQLRGRVLEILSDRMLPQRTAEVEAALREGRAETLIPLLLPGETAYLSAEFRRKYPDQIPLQGPAGKELDTLVRSNPAETGWERITADFGVPHPVLAHTYAREFLSIKPLPMFMGYSSRLMAECWDSNNLYWARLADEQGYPPVTLNRLAPELTHRMVERLFATNLEDWKAIPRAMRETGDEFRQGKLVPLPKGGTASLQ